MSGDMGFTQCLHLISKNQIPHFSYQLRSPLNDDSSTALPHFARIYSQIALSVPFSVLAYLKMYLFHPHI